MLAKLRIQPTTLLAFIAVFMLGSATAATAGSLINGGKIKKGSIPYSALSGDAKKKLAGNTGPQGPAAPTYWALINQDGSVARSSAGVTSTGSLNSGYYQYRVSFPRDISNCAYAGSTADSAVIGNNEYTYPSWVAVSRSNQGNNVAAVNVWNTSGNSVQDSFTIAAYC